MVDLPVADQWFVEQAVDNDITLITEPNVHPLLRCNVWHVKGRDRDLVIDTALGLHPLRHLVDRHLPGGLLAVATHAHADHVGGLHEFEHRAIHRAESAEIEQPGLMSIESAHFPPSVIEPYREAGYDIPPSFLTASPGPGFTATVWEIKAAEPTLVVDDGDVIDTGDRVFEVVHLPGHSPGSIALWEAGTGTLFSGDAVYDGPLLDGLEGSDVDDYAQSMERLLRLPVRVVHAGHEASFSGERLAQICTAYLEGSSASRPS